MANLTGQSIKDTYQELVTVGTGNTITNGTGSVITDLAVTASNALVATSASYAPIDPAFSGSVASEISALEGSVTALNLETGSLEASISANSSSIASLTNATASYVTNAQTSSMSVASAVSASHASTATLANYAGTAGSATTAATASYTPNAVVNGSVLANVITLTKGDGSAINLTVATGSATSSSYADYAVSSSHATYAETAGSSTTSVSASYASNAGSADSVAFANISGKPTLVSGSAQIDLSQATGVAANAVSASHAVQADSSLTADSATSASYAVTASYALNVPPVVTPTLDQVTTAGNTTANSISVGQITGSEMYLSNGAIIAGDLTVNGTVTYISSSTLQIGDNVIEINANKAAGNSGILAYDTTSPYTASLIWDAGADRWKAGAYGSEETVILAGDTGSMSVANAVSASYASNASSADTATSASHAVQADSALAADTATSASHAVIADSALTAGSATTATSASHAVNADNAISASYATTALSASYAPAGATPDLQAVTTAGNTTTNYMVVTSAGGENWMLANQNLFFDGSAVPQGQFAYNPAGGLGSQMELGGLATTPLVLDHNLTGLYLQYQKINLNTGGAAGKAIVYNGSNNTAEWGVPSTASYASTAGTAASATTATSASYASNASTADSATTATSATSASYATYAATAGTASTVTSASYASNASTADSALTADSATSASHALYADAAGSATTATTATTASYVAGSNVDGQVASALSASYAVTASYALNGGGGGGAAGLVAGTGVDSMKSADALTTNPAVASESYTIALGDGASATGYNNIAIGYDLLTAGETGSIAIGAHVTSSGFNSVAIGTSVVASGYQSVALGSLATAPDFAATAVGGYAKAEATLAVSVGNGSTIRSYGGVGIGASTEAEGGNYAIAIGQASKAWGEGVVTIGYQARGEYGNANSVAIGRESKYGFANNTVIGAFASASDGGNNVAIGYQSVAATSNGVAVGNAAQTTNAQAIAIGNQAVASGSNSITIGPGTSYNYGDHSVAIGESVKLKSTYSVAIGTQAFGSGLNTGGAESVAIGTNAGVAVTTAGELVLVGKGAGQSISTASGTVAIGKEALATLTTNGANTAVGYLALNKATAAHNTALGHNAGRYYSGTSGDATPENGTFIGSQVSAGAVSTVNETVIGFNATGNGTNTVTLGNTSVTGTYLNGDIKQTKSGNTLTISNFGNANNFFAVGPNSTTTGGGNNNIGIGGQNVLEDVTTGTFNIAIGGSALKDITTGFANVAIGGDAGKLLTDDQRNVAIGLGALGNAGSVDPANRNVAIGDYAGSSTTTVPLTSPNNCVYLGKDTKAGIAAPSYETVIGADAIGNGSNTVTIGNSSLVGSYIQVDWTVVSDERDKTNFAEVPHGLDFVKELKPTAYQFKEERDSQAAHGPVRYGFKAQDILALEGDNPVIVNADDPEKLKYTQANLVPVLVKAIQELEARVAALEARLS